MDRAASRYLTVGFLICLLSMLLGPPMPEHLLLRHVRRIERRVERSASADAAVEAVTAYLEANMVSINRIQRQLRAYGPERSLAAFHGLEGRLERLSSSIADRPELARELGDVLLDFMP
jgi:hypothetical protein